MLPLDPSCSAETLERGEGREGGEGRERGEGGGREKRGWKESEQRSGEEEDGRKVSRGVGKRRMEGK